MGAKPREEDFHTFYEAHKQERDKKTSNVILLNKNENPSLFGLVRDDGDESL